MFDNDCNMNTLSGTLDYCKKRGFIKNTCGCFNPFDIYDENGRCYCHNYDNDNNDDNYDHKYEYHIEDNDIDPFDKLEAYFGVGVPNVTNSEEHYIEDEIITRESYKIENDILSLPNYIVPFNTPCNRFDTESIKPKSPVRVKLSINDEKYDLTYSNIRNNNIYGIEMANKDMDIDLFNELTHHYKQRHFIKDKSNKILDSVKPNNVDINKGDIIKIHNKVFIVLKYKHQHLRYELRELSTQKLYEYNLLLVPFSIILFDSVKRDILLFDKTSLKPLIIDSSSYFADFDICESNDTISSIVTEILEDTVIENIPEEIPEEIEQESIKLIDNYFSSCIENESIYNIDKSVSKTIIFQEDDTSGEGKCQHIVCNRDSSIKLDPIKEQIEEDLDDKCDENISEDNTESKGYCTIM